VFALPGFPEPLFPNIPHAEVARADLTLPVFSGLRLEHNSAAAGHERAASEGDLASGRAALRLETVRAYWALVAARQQRATVERSLAAFDAHAKQAADRRKQGLVTANDVLAVQVERDRTEVQRLRAEAQAEVAQANLARLTGLPEDATIEPDTVDAADADTVVDGADALLLRAMDARPELRAATERARAALDRASAAKGAFVPQISVLASALTARPNDRFFPRQDEWNSSWSVGVSASWSILDGGRTWAEAAQRSALARAADLAREDLGRRVRLDVRTRRLDLLTAIRAQQVAELALAAAVENERVARDRYREGVLPSSELLDAEVAHREAELERVRAIADRRVARAALIVAVGD
jgi:outer membrane protein TolC